MDLREVAARRVSWRDSLRGTGGGSVSETEFDEHFLSLVEALERELGASYAEISKAYWVDEDQLNDEDRVLSVVLCPGARPCAALFVALLSEAEAHVDWTYVLHGDGATLAVSESGALVCGDRLRDAPTLGDVMSRMVGREALTRSNQRP